MPCVLQSALAVPETIEEGRLDQTTLWRSFLVCLKSCVTASAMTAASPVRRSGWTIARFGRGATSDRAGGPGGVV